MKSQFITAVAADMMAESWGGAFILCFYTNGPRMYEITKVSGGQTIFMSMQVTVITLKCMQTGSEHDVRVDSLGTIYAFDREVAKKFADNLKVEFPLLNNPNNESIKANA